VGSLGSPPVLRRIKLPVKLPRPNQGPKANHAEGRYPVSESRSGTNPLLNVFQGTRKVSTHKCTYRTQLHCSEFNK